VFSDEEDKSQAVIEVVSFYMDRIIEVEKTDIMLSRAHDLIFVWADTTHGAEERREAVRAYNKLRDSVRNEVNLLEAARVRAIDSVLGIECTSLLQKQTEEPGEDSTG